VADTGPGLEGDPEAAFIRRATCGNVHGIRRRALACASDEVQRSQRLPPGLMLRAAEASVCTPMTMRAGNPPNVK
jgi:hypothetical protein